MDTFENNDIPQGNEHTEIPAESVQETPVQTEKEPEVYAPTSENSTYRNAGVGRKESPFANSPYVMNHQNPVNQPNHSYYQGYQNSQPYGYQRPQPQQPTVTPPMQPEFPPKQEKTRKKNSKTVFKTILSAVLILALVLGSCVVTRSSLLKNLPILRLLPVIPYPAAPLPPVKA